MRINTNLIAQNTYIQYTKNNNKISSSVAKLSSGYAINSAADNAAGLAISEKMRAQIRGLDQASSNSQDAISLVQTAEGSLSSSTTILQRMREVAVQSSSDTNNDDIDREALQDEFSQLQSELNDIATTTTYNKKNLLDGTLASSSKNLTNVSLANSSTAISVGNASAGAYKFTVSVKQETSAVSGASATGSASLGTAAASTFDAVLPANFSNPTAQTSLYNGNYTLTAKATTDGTSSSMTVTAKGDNGKTFTANVDNAQLTTLTGGAGTLALTFASSDGTGDGFTLNLGTKAAITTSTNGLDALSKAVNDVTVSFDGGVDAKDATYGVYANCTGADSVKLHAGDTSVTFSNGATVSFDKLTSTDAAVASYNTAITPYTYAITPGSALDISSGFSGLASTSKINLTALTTGTSLNAGTTNLSSITMKSIANNSDSTGAVITITDGKNDYTANVTFDNDADTGMKKDLSSDALHLTFTGAGGTIKADLSSDADQSSQTISLGSGVSGTLATVTSTSGTVTHVPTPTLSAGMLSKLGSTTDQTDATTGAVNTTSATSFTVADKSNAGLTFQVGANAGDTMTINIDKMDSSTLGINSAKVSTQQAASAAIASVDSAINTVSGQRAYLGAIQNRLDYKIDNLNTSSENLTSAESQIRDVDMAKEMTTFTNANILQQAATAMLAQANSLPQNVLSLLK